MITDQIAERATYPLIDEDPFRLSVGPTDLIRHQTWRLAVEQAMSALLSGPGLTLLLAPAGCGKTLLLMDLEQRLRGSGVEVRRLAAARFDPLSALPIPDNAFVLIDEVRSNPGVLASLPGSGRFHCLIAELPDFDQQLAGLPRVPAVVRLEALTPDLARAFVTARFSQAHQPSDLLAPDALDLLIAESEGIPRRLCMIGGQALRAATAQGARQIGVEHVERAALSAAAADRDERSRSEPSVGSVSRPIDPDRARALRPLAMADASSSAVRPARTRGGWKLAAALVMVTVSAAVWEVGFPWRAPTPIVPDRSPAVGPVEANSVIKPMVQADPAMTSVRSAGSVPAPAVPVEAAADTAVPAAMPSAAPITTQPPSTDVAPTPATSAHIVVTYPRGNRAAANQAGVIAEQLRRAGYAAADPVPAARARSTARLQVFFAEDRQIAEQVRTALGDTAPATELRSALRRGSLPRPGTLELMVLAGTPVDAWSRALERVPPPSWPDPDTLASPTIAATTPPDGATLETYGALPHVDLAWTHSSREKSRFFVEVEALDGATAREIFAAYADRGPVRVELENAGRRYAWRVHAVGRDRGHYASSRWFRFEAAPDGLTRN